MRPEANGDRFIRVLVDGYPACGEAHAQRRARQLEGEAVALHRVVGCHRARMLQREDPLEVRAGAGDEGTADLPRRHDKRPVVPGEQVLLGIGVGRLVRGAPLEA